MYHDQIAFLDKSHGFSLGPNHVNTLIHNDKLYDAQSNGVKFILILEMTDKSCFEDFHNAFSILQYLTH